MAKVIPITTENFQSELMREAETRPVVLTFASSQMPECESFNADLDALSSELDFTLGTASLDAPENIAFEQMFRIHTLPFAVVLSKGEVIDAFQGAASKDALKKRLESYFISDEERSRRAMESAVESGNFKEALEAVEREQAKNPADDHLKILEAKCRLGLGDGESAKGILSGISQNSAEYASAKNLLDLMELLVEAAKKDPVEGDAADFREACRMAAGKDYRSALELLYRLTLSNPGFRDGAAKKAMVALFGVIGPKDPLTWEFRGKLNTTLFI